MHRLVLAIGLAASVPAAAAPAALAVDPPKRTVPAPLPSVRVKGLDRFDRVSLLEAGVLCGTRAGQSPVCATEPQWQAYAAPYEALDDVVKLQALGPGHCVLFGSGELRCGYSAAQGIADPSTWPVIRRDARDFVISATTTEARVYTLDNEMALHAYRLASDPRRITDAIVAKEARWYGWSSNSGVCAVVGVGDVLCSDPKDPDGPLQPTGFHHAVAMFNGGAILEVDGTFTYVLDSWAPFAPWPKQGTDYGYQLGCVLTPSGEIECTNTLGPWVKVTLPAGAERLAPSGDISCAKLVDNTTVCYGPFLAQIERLAKRPRRSRVLRSVQTW